MKSCDKCGKSAVTFIRYSGNHLCARHFNEFFERRVKKEIRRQCTLKKGEVLTIAVSGGKDSVVAMHILHRILKERKDIKIHAISVDEGIDGYRPQSLKIAEKGSVTLDVLHHNVSFKEVVGATMDEIACLPIKTTPCSFCGVFRRKCLNMKAKEIGASKLATGLNLDDTAQSILMNFARGDVAKLARLGPHKGIQEGLIPRIQPLRLIPEKESYLYAMLNDLEFHDGVCPYSQWALRGRFRDIINNLEKDTPGTRHALLKTYDSIAPLLLDSFPPASLSACSECGEPTLNKICKACGMIRDIAVMRAKK